MQHRFTQINIDRFFRSLDRLEPIYNENKVHQIINSPEATARLKGKTLNPLKITIMTSLLITLVTAIILWTGNDTKQAEMQNKAEQVQFVENATTNTNLKSSTQNDTENLANEVNVKTTDNEREIESSSLDAQPTNGEINDPEISDFVPATLASKEDSTNTNRKSKPLTPPATIKGDLKMVLADQKLLEKLGFRFKYLPEYNPDSVWEYGCLPYSVYYNNFYETNKFSSKSNLPIVYSFTNRIEGKATFTNSIYFQEIEINDSASFNNLSFYPNIVSYPSGFVRFNLYPDNFIFEMANDTLLPIFVPTQIISNDPNNWVLWFNVTDSLIALLPESIRSQVEIIQNNKILKKEFPSLNLIDYQQEALVDSSRFIELSNEELFQIGFSIIHLNKNNQSNYGINGEQRLVYEKTDECYHLKLTITQFGSSLEKGNLKENCIYDNLALITTTIGDFENVVFSGKSALKNMVPILIRHEQFPEILNKDLVFWFTPTNYIFQHLPERISVDLQKEYNYIVAENKSALEKPECVYFEECKNTLLLNNFKVFPNPANQQTTVTFTLPKAINGGISLLDLAGRERQVLLPETTLNKGFQRFEFDLSGVSEGMYLITLYSDQGIQVQRLMVSH